MELFDALIDHKLDEARRLLEAGADPNRDRYGRLLLHHFAEANNLPSVQLLLEYAADASLKDSDGNTVMHYAASRGVNNTDLYKLLLQSRASCNDRNNWGTTPFHYALQHRDLEIVQLLLDNGADITAVGVSGWTALHFAAENQTADVLQFVLNQGLDVNCRTNTGFTPLHFAAVRGSAEACELLLRNGAMVNANSETGHSPMSFLLSRRFQSGYANVCVLLNYGARVAGQYGRGTTILEMAAGWRVSQGVRNRLMQHMAEIRYLHSEINEDDQKTIENNECYREYFQRCLQELESMKGAKFYNNVSFFDICMESQKVISGYARNEELVEAFEEGGFSDRFPIYIGLVKEWFCAAVQAQRLRTVAAETLSGVFKLNDSSHPVIQTVLSFLSDEYLEFLEKK